MKTLLLTSLVTIGLASYAAAADMPGRAVALPPAPTFAPGPVFYWGGFYAGVHGVWLRNDVDAIRATPAPAGILPGRVSLYDEGFGGGAQIGYNVQLGDTVAGVEADITATEIGRTRTFTVASPGAPFAPATSLSTGLSSHMDFFGTVKGRVGFAFPSIVPLFQQSLVYVTGGLGYADIDNRTRILTTLGGTPLLSLGARSDDMKVGFVVGGGTENAITNTVSIKTETLYYNLEDETLRLKPAIPGAPVRYRFENDGWISRIGLNVRFGTF
jgi:outer membrane immunogenic protein